MSKWSKVRALAHHVRALGAFTFAASAIDSSYKEEGCASHYTDEALAARAALQREPAIAAAITRWWQAVLRADGAAEEGGGGGEWELRKESFLALSVRMQKALLRDFDHGDAVLEAKADWANDVGCLGDEAGAVHTMTRQQFRASLFELADLWCETAAAVEYVAFFDQLLHAISSGDGNGTWRRESDIAFAEMEGGFIAEHSPMHCTGVAELEESALAAARDLNGGGGGGGGVERGLAALRREGMSDWFLSASTKASSMKDVAAAAAATLGARVVGTQKATRVFMRAAGEAAKEEGGEGGGGGGGGGGDQAAATAAAAETVAAEASAAKATATALAATAAAATAAATAGVVTTAHMPLLPANMSLWRDVPAPTLAPPSPPAKPSGGPSYAYIARKRRRRRQRLPTLRQGATRQQGRRALVSETEPWWCELSQEQQAVQAALQAQREQAVRARGFTVRARGNARKILQQNSLRVERNAAAWEQQHALGEEALLRRMRLDAVLAPQLEAQTEIELELRQMQRHRCQPLFRPQQRLPPFQHPQRRAKQKQPYAVVGSW